MKENDYTSNDLKTKHLHNLRLYFVLSNGMWCGSGVRVWFNLEVVLGSSGDFL
jgi:hypothetical protein